MFYKKIEILIYFYTGGFKVFKRIKVIIYILIIIILIGFIPRSINAQEDLDLQESILKQLFSIEHIFNFYHFNNYQLNSQNYLYYYYRNRDFQPVWFDDHNLLPEAEKFIDLLQRTEKEGLIAEDYNTDYINDLFNQIKENKISQKEMRLTHLELLLTNAYFIYISDIHKGRINYLQMERQWVQPAYFEEYINTLESGLANSNLIEEIDKYRTEYDKYKRLINILNEYQEIEKQTSISLDRTLRPGDRDEKIKIIRDRLKTEPGQNIDLSTEDEELFDDNLKQAVMSLQERYNISKTGNIGYQTAAILNFPVRDIIKKIKLNLDRLRWLEADTDSRYVLVNLPEYKVHVFENDSIVKSMRVVIGRKDRPTPVFNEKIERLVFNPTWYIPRSIIFEKYLPEAKNNYTYLNNNYIRVYERTNNDYQQRYPSHINWEELDKDNFDYHFWQESGPWNSLGNVIFRSTNLDNIYLHDTPERHLFQLRERHFSFGCVRVERALELALYLLKNDDWDKQRINNLVSQNTETQIRLSEPVSLHLIYLTVWADENGQLNMRSDVYERDQKLLVYF